MTTQKQLEASNLYGKLMGEVRLRIAAIDLGTSGALPLDAHFVREFCFLQIRMICELIALGCLVAHGDLYQTKKLKKEWAADKIIDEMEKLHPDFFPVAATQGREENGGHTLNGVKNCLSKKELIALYHECGNILHRGNVKKLLKTNMPIQIHFPDITARAQKLRDLLSVHIVTMIGGKRMFICVLYAPGDKVQVATAESILLLAP